MVSDPISHQITRVISGGQTGVDRAALDVAIAFGIDYGGWCPKGGWAEDSPAPPGVLARYGKLSETPETDPRQRTEWNVRDSDATLIFVPAGDIGSSPGTVFAFDCAKRLGKPLLVADPDASYAAALVGALLADNPGIRALNIAGPRESEASGVYASVHAVLTALFRP